MKNPHQYLIRKSEEVLIRRLAWAQLFGQQTIRRRDGRKVIRLRPLQKES